MTTTLTLPGKPQVGFSIFVQQQRFECTGVRPYRTRDGRDVELTMWEAPCAECGAIFDLVTPRRDAPVRVDRRRCDVHRKSGRTVQPRRKRGA